MRKKTFYTKLLALVMVALMIAVSFVAKTPSRADDTDTSKLSVYSPQQILRNYGLTALENIHIDAHCHSNFLVKVLNNNANSGLNATDEYEPHNKTEEFYFETFGELNNTQISNREDTGYLFVGQTIKKVSQWSNGIEIENSSGDKATINKPGPGRVTFDSDYVNMNALTKKLVGYNKSIKNMETEGNCSYDFSERNSRHIDINGTGTHVLNGLSVDELIIDTPTVFLFKDVDVTDTETSIVINVDLKGMDSVSFHKFALAYGKISNTINNAENSATSNHNRIYYNFYDSSKADLQYTGTINFQEGFGTIIAPSANVNLNQNWDGVVVAKDITIGSQFHRIAGAINPPNPTESSVVEQTATGTFTKTSVAGNQIVGAKLRLTIVSANNLSEVNIDGATPSFVEGTNKKAIEWETTSASNDISNLPEGEYVWSETYAPTEYEVSPDIKFRVSADGKIYEYSGNDDYSTTPTKILKMIDTTKAQGIFSKKSAWGKELKGAELTLSANVDLNGVHGVSGAKINISGTTISWISVEVPTVIGKLPDGEYKWSENDAPAGFDESSDIKFKILEGKIYKYDTTTNNYETAPINEKDALTMTDDCISTDASFSKISSVDNGELAGAELSLTIYSDDFDLKYVTKKSGSAEPEWSNNNNTITWISTNDSLELSKLPYGIYEWKEISAPAGFEIASSVKFRVGDEGAIYEYNSATGAYDIPLADKKLKMVDKAETTPEVMANGKFSKVSSVNNGELPGATLSLTIKSGASNLSKVKRLSGPETFTLSTDKKTITWISTETPMELSGLPVGEYEWKEVSAPVGYKISSSVSFKVGADGKISKKVGTKWEELKVDEMLTMVDEALKDPNTEKPTTEKPTTEKPTTEKPTTEKPTTQKPTTEKPTTQKPTTEKPTTQKPTTGKPTTEKDKTDEETTTAPKKDVGSLQIIVYDEKTGDVVPKATVQVTYPNKKVKEFKTNKKGEITIKNLPPGKYKSETIKVPDGYTVSAGKVYKSNVVAGGTTVCEVFIVTHKNDVDGGNSDVDASNDNTSDNSMTDDSNKVDNSDTISDNTNNITTGDRFPLQQIIILMGVTLFGIIVLLIVKTGER